MSVGFSGISTVKYVPANTVPLAPLDPLIPEGLDVLNRYEITLGAGATSSPFYAPYLSRYQAASTTIVYDECDTFNTLKLVMGLMSIAFQVIKTPSRTQQSVFDISVEIIFTYSYEGTSYTKKAIVPPGYMLSTPVLLPVPCVRGAEDLCLNLGTALLPIFVYLNQTPEQIYNTMTLPGTGATGPASLSLSAYLLTNEYDVDAQYPSGFQPALSSVSSTLTTSFSVNNASLGSIGSLLGKVFSVRVVGGLTTTLQFVYQVVNRSAPTASVIGETSGQTLGAIMNQTN